VLWSAQEVTQLLGRLVRQGQLKVVIAYHIIANGTTDIALNNISFDKRSMHQGYTRIPAALGTATLAMLGFFFLDATARENH
jgi:hypothetical protein